MTVRHLVILSLIFTPFLLLGCDDSAGSAEDGFASGNSPIIDVSPMVFSFPSLEPGSDAVSREVTITNNGSATLKLTNFRGSFNDPNAYQLDWYTEADPSMVFAGIDSMTNHIADRIIDIEPESFITLVLEYTPTTDGAQGSIQFSSNDVDSLSVAIPIQGNASDAELRVTPGSVDFGRVAAGDSVTQDVIVTNVGTANAIINGFSLSGSMDFTVRFNGEDPLVNPGIYADPDQDGEVGLASGAQMTLQMIYSPPTEGPDEGELVIASNDQNRGQVSVPIRANGASPCIRLLFPDTQSSDMSELRFGASLIGAVTTQDVILESCGGQRLTINSIRVEGDEAYALGDGLPPSFPVPLAAADLETNTYERRTFEVTFSPSDADVYEGVLIVESDDPVNGELRIPIVGLGTVNACPVAAVTEANFNVLPLEILTLDGSASTDPDSMTGAPQRYEWVVISRPEGSTAEPVESFTNIGRPADGGREDDPLTPQAQFFVDLAGEYTIALTVTDELGFSAPSETCTQADAIIFIEARPDEDILVELVWSTPGDDNETDMVGTDIDLHLQHPDGIGWSLSPYDCYYANANPDWGPTGPQGNPSLDIDDVNGAGPENINLDDPEFTDNTVSRGPYLVGVHYYSSGDTFGFGGPDYGMSTATIRIYLFGSIEVEMQMDLQTTANFWEVAGIIWTATEKRVQTIDRFYPTVP
jgi:hypothetical protein